MTNFDDPSFLNAYQFPRWSTSINRPHTSLPTKRSNHMFKLGIDNQNHIQSLSRKHLIRHNNQNSIERRILSPRLLSQPTPTPDVCSIADQLSTISSIPPSYHITPIRIKSAALTIPSKTNSEDIYFKNFPKQSHEKRKVTQDRKKRILQAQKYAQNDPENWFHLRQSLEELKRLAITEEILVDPSTSAFHCDGYSFEALKQVVREQQDEKKINKYKYESGMCSSMDSMPSSNIRSRTSLTCPSTLSRSRLSRPSTETYSHPIYEPLIVAAKPIHPLLVTGNTRSSKTKVKPPSSAPSRVRSAFIQSEKRSQLLISDLSNTDDHTLSPQLQNVKEEDEQQQQSIKTPRPKTSSIISLKSTIKLKAQTPRSRSAVDIKCSYTFNKTYPRFILITDQEHRIESWYHQYPFIIYDDLIQSFQSKSNQSTISAYFIDDYQQLQQSNNSNKRYLQGQPFHINNDWNKYDLICISNNIYQQIIIQLQTIIKLSGKIIPIYQINHHEDLKAQLRYICKQLNQQILSHV